MTIEILGDGRKRRFNPDLGHQVNEEFEKEQQMRRKEEEMPGTLERKTTGENTEESLLEKIDSNIEATAGGMDIKTLGKSHIKSILISRTMSQLCRNYSSFIGAVIGSEKIDEAVKFIEKLNFRPPSVMTYLFVKEKLPEYHEKIKRTHGTANYLSGLIKVSKEKDFVFDLRKINKKNIPFHYLGKFLDDKQLVIFGDVGHNFGYESRNAVIYLKGNARNVACSGMRYSKIIIDGNVGDYLANGCRESEIFVLGNIKGTANTVRNNTIIKQKIKGKWVRRYP